MLACRASSAFFCAFLSLACTPGGDAGASSAADPSGWSSPGGASSAAPSAAPSALASRFELVDRLGSLRKATPRLRSQHLAGDYDGEVLVNEAASAYPTLGPSRPLGEGAVLLEALYRQEQTEVAVYFAMVKQPAGSASPWAYLVVEPNGRIQQQGVLPLCERCHTEAPHDHVFGRPR